MNVEIYCDGSCHPSYKIGAWVALVFIDNKQYEITGIVKETTCQVMELQAVLASLDFLTNKGIPPHVISSSIVIYTDSQYVTRLPSRRSG